MEDQCSQTTEPEENWNFIKNEGDKEREKLRQFLDMGSSLHDYN